MKTLHTTPLASISQQIADHSNAKTTACEQDQLTGSIDVWFSAPDDAYKAIVVAFLEQYEGTFRFIDCGFNIRVLHIENNRPIVN